jgi:Family of unknown function (DUF6152)
VILRIAVAVMMAAGAAWGHHSIAAEFDTSRVVVLKGKVTRVEWMNPHVHFWVDAVDVGGKVTNWELESVAPNYLRRLGWTKGSLKVGDLVTVRAFAAKDDPHLAKTDSVTLPGGRVVTTGRVDDGYSPGAR